MFGFLCELLGIKIQKIESYGLDQFPLLDLLQGCTMARKLSEFEHVSQRM